MGKPQAPSIDDGDQGTTERPFDAGDATQVGERRVNAKNAERERMAGLGLLMASKQGRSYTWWLLGLCGVFRTSFTGNSATFFNEGKRDIGLHVLADLQREFPEQYLQMTKENANA